MQLGKLKISRNSIVDFIVVFLQITNNLCIVQAYTLSKLHIPLYIDLIVITLFAYLVRFRKMPFLNIKHRWILLLFFLIYFLDFFQNLSYDFVHAVIRLFFLLDLLIFVEYLFAMYRFGSNYKQNLRDVSAPLAYFSVYNAVVISLSLFLLLSGILSINNNVLGDNPLIHDNYSKGAVYSFPGYLSIVLHNSNRTLSSIGIPALSGITHEPHALFYLIGAGYFLVIDRCKNTKQSMLVFLLFALALVASSSTTAILVFLFCITFDFLWKTIVKKDFGNVIYVIIIIVPLFSFLITHFDELFQSATLMLTSQLGGDDVSSKGVSEAMLKYVVTPHGLFGHGNIPNGDYDQSLNNVDIGIITSALDILLFVSISILCLKNVFSKDEHVHYIGMSVMYYLLHNLKMSFQGFNYGYMAYMIVLTLLASSLSKGQSKAVCIEPNK